jgi:hypothetical protein
LSRRLFEKKGGYAMYACGTLNIPLSWKGIYMRIVPREDFEI